MAGTNADPIAYVLRVSIVALGYTATTIAAQALLTTLGVAADVDPPITGVGPLLVAGLLIGGVLGPLATRTPGTRRWHVLIWTAAIYLTMVGLLIEGMYFTPDLAPLEDLLAGLLTQFVVALGTAGLLTALFVPPGREPKVATLDRPWWSLSGRILAAAGLYVVLFFFVTGSNYVFVTQPYYETHNITLLTPPLDVILALELLRGVLLTLAVIPFVQTYEGSLRGRQLATAAILFLVAGVVPLLLQFETLPSFLVVTSSYEIFLQVVPTGVAVATLLAPTPEPHHPADYW